MLGVIAPAALRDPPQLRCQDVELSNRPRLPAPDRRLVGCQRPTTVATRCGRSVGRGAEGGIEPVRYRRW